MNTRLRIAAVAYFLAALATGLHAQAPGQLPPAPQNVPKVGEKAPDFTLPDASQKPVRLSALLSDSATPGQKGSWVLLIFYRGYW